MRLIHPLSICVIKEYIGARDIITTTLRCRGLTPVQVGFVYMYIYVIGTLVDGLDYLHYK